MICGQTLGSNEVYANAGTMSRWDVRICRRERGLFVISVFMPRSRLGARDRRASIAPRDEGCAHAGGRDVLSTAPGAYLIDEPLRRVRLLDCLGLRGLRRRGRHY